MNKNRNTPLHEAILQNDPSAVQSLIDQGADINAQNKQRETPLMKACKSNKTSIDIIWYLLQAGADPNIQDKQMDIPIRFCLGNMEQLHLLVEAGSDVNHRDQYGYTLLHFCAKEGGKIDDLAYLLEVGSDVNAQDNAENTPLMYTCQYKAGLEKTILLLSTGADPNMGNRWQTPLSVCTDNQLELLLDAGADINLINNDKTILMHIVEWGYGKVPKIKRLLELGADTEFEDGNGDTAIKLIMIRYPERNTGLYTAILKLLIDAGANVNPPDGFWRSNLHTVTGENNLEALRLLLEAGADPYRKHEGRIPLDLTMDPYREYPRHISDQELEKMGVKKIKENEDVAAIYLLTYMPILPRRFQKKYGELHRIIHKTQGDVIDYLGSTYEELYDPNLKNSILGYLR
jgi:ankyrin repeat protein